MKKKVQMENKKWLKNEVKEIKNKKIIISIILLILLIFAWLTKAWVIDNYLDLEILCSWESNTRVIENYWDRSWYSINSSTKLKPVIYLYPEQKQDIYVKLDYKWKIFVDYPEYNNEIKWWKVNADIDSTIINNADKKEYSYLFWEWNSDEEINWDLSSWFVVKWTESRKFLQDILPKIWLTAKEYNEFIVYWYPIMQKNKYNLIHFAGKEYTDYAILETTPKYDSILRVFMVLKSLDKPIDIKTQKFTGFKRNGFSVVEWGGTILK